MQTNTHKANRLSKLSPEERGDLVVDTVLKTQLRQIMRIAPDAETKAAAERRLRSFTPASRRATSAA